MEQLLAELPKELVLDVAGKYDSALSETWLNAGLNGFIFAGQDKVGKLNRYQRQIGRGCD